jgi:hypothetical protein
LRPIEENPPPAHDVEVIDCNGTPNASSWGAVFADATMEARKIRDSEIAAEIKSAFNHRGDFEPPSKGRRIPSIGDGFVGIGRKRLLGVLLADKRRTLAARGPSSAKKSRSVDWRSHGTRRARYYGLSPKQPAS